MRMKVLFIKKKMEAVEHTFWEYEYQYIQYILNDFATNCLKNIHTYVVFVEKEFSYLDLMKI